MNFENLSCIDLDQPTLEGFRKFISTWLYRGDGFNLIVDPGPLSTIPHLLSEIRRIGVNRIDYVLLTHIHIDHAGGTGALLKEFPNARVFCSPEGIPHMIAPEKLWKASQKILGTLADAYGEIVPIPEGHIQYCEILENTGIRAFLTPGHAQHHSCYLMDDLLFAGEVAGIRDDVPDGIYMRPSTPPRFILPVALDSIDRMSALAPRCLALAHHGLVDNANQHFTIARNQLLLWIKGCMETSAIPGKHREEALASWLLESDAHFSNITKLPDDIQVRERYFMGNSLRGMAEYVDSLTETERLSLSATIGE